MKQEFDRSWRAEVLRHAPLIAPARQFVYPMQIAGEEDALARGALQMMVSPARGGAYLLMCALGFSDPAMPTGVFACPNKDEMCAVAGGYAYFADTTAPERCTLHPMKPVVALHATEDLLLLVGFHTMAAWGRDGLAWETARLSWEGLRIIEVGAQEVSGFGWDLATDKEVPFTVELATGKHVGGGYRGR